MTQKVQAKLPISCVAENSPKSASWLHHHNGVLSRNSLTRRTPHLTSVLFILN